VPDSDRRDIFEDCIFTIAKREKEEAKALKKRNMKILAQVAYKYCIKYYPQKFSLRAKHAKLSLATNHHHYHL
jgi:hypothetical protein